jgi:hypothetical protein
MLAFDPIPSLVQDIENQFVRQPEGRQGCANAVDGSKCWREGRHAVFKWIRQVSEGPAGRRIKVKVFVRSTSRSAEYLELVALGPFQVWSRPTTGRSTPAIHRCLPYARDTHPRSEQFSLAALRECIDSICNDSPLPSCLLTTRGLHCAHLGVHLDRYEDLQCDMNLAKD